MSKPLTAAERSEVLLIQGDRHLFDDDGEGPWCREGEATSYRPEYVTCGRCLLIEMDRGGNLRKEYVRRRVDHLLKGET